MCYALLLSTTSNENLSDLDTELVKFARNLPDLPQAAKLIYPNRWYVASKSGCSCGFRHLYSIELGFDVPVAWYPEEEDDITATLQFISHIRRLLKKGERVDCIDAWEYPHMHAVPEKEIEVALSAISDQEFRLFENYHFRFTMTPNIT